MGWLVAQLWFWLLVAFLLGSLAAYVLIVTLLPEDLDAPDPAPGEC